MKTKDIKDLDKEKYPTLCKIFKVSGTNRIISKNEFDKLCPGFMAEIYNLTKEENAKVLLRSVKPITKVNSQEFFNEENYQKD